MEMSRWNACQGVPNAVGMLVVRCESQLCLWRHEAVHAMLAEWPSLTNPQDLAAEFGTQRMDVCVVGVPMMDQIVACKQGPHAAIALWPRPQNAALECRWTLRDLVNPDLAR